MEECGEVEDIRLKNERRTVEGYINESGERAMTWGEEGEMKGEGGDLYRCRKVVEKNSDELAGLDRRTTAAKGVGWC